MVRGGHREGSGRPSAWVSSSETKAIRLPEWMVGQVMEVARKLDRGEQIESVQNHSACGSEIKSLLALTDRWRASVPVGQEKAPRWIKTVQLLAELDASLSELREGGKAQ